jgi:hypothetical protein
MKEEKEQFQKLLNQQIKELNSKDEQAIQEMKEKKMKEKDV